LGMVAGIHHPVLLAARFLRVRRIRRRTRTAIQAFYLRVFLLHSLRKVPAHIVRLVVDV
jgi:hypothetical protein